MFQAISQAVRQPLYSFVLCGLLGGCNLPQDTSASNLAPTLMTSPEQTPATSQVVKDNTRPTPTGTPVPIEWESIGRGIERTYLDAVSPVSGGNVRFYTLRLDPTQTVFRVYHDPQKAHLIDEWQRLTGDAIVVNGSFFGADQSPIGRIIVDGEIRGDSLDYGPDSIGVPGVFAVKGNAAWIYTLGHDNYSPQGFRFDQALECYPILVLPGGKVAYPIDTGKRARRTIIGVDEEGYTIIVLIDSPVFSLYEISNWLAFSNLRLDSALNLDGGRSSGISVNVPDERKLISSLVPVPIVLGISEIQDE